MNIPFKGAWRRGVLALGIGLGVCFASSGIGSASPLRDDRVATAGADARPDQATSLRPMAELKVSATIHLANTADWVAVTPDGVWVGSKGPFAVNEVDPATNAVTRVDLPGDPCAGMVADSDDLWVPLCGSAPKLAKVDLKTRTLRAVFDVGPAAAEGGIAAGAGSIWMIIDKGGTLARIDPSDGAVIYKVQLPPGSFNPVYSDGRIWVTCAQGAELTIVDVTTGEVSGRMAAGPHPRFLTATAGAVWTLNQGDGSLTKIDQNGLRPVLTTPLRTPGPGGDITHSDDEVWVTMIKTPLTVVDAGDAVVLCQWKGDGGDALGIGHGAIWLTNLSSGTVSRINLSDVPKSCRAASYPH